MWTKFIASVKKELLLLIRDIPALSMLFLMPVTLVLVMTMLQDSTFKILDEQRLSIIILNSDTGSFGKNIVKGLQASKLFKVTTAHNSSVAGLKSKVAKGKFTIGIVVNKGATQSITKNLNREIYHQFPEEITRSVALDTVGAGVSAKVDVFFDPVIKYSVKQSVLSALREFSAGVESEIIYSTYASLFKQLLGVEMKKNTHPVQLVEIHEQKAATEATSTIPNSTQHNVPAYTLFAIFFIVIPLAGNIIKERTSGVALRLKTMPGSVVPSLLGKTAVYFFLGFIQATVMFLMGIFILPLLGLPQLNIQSNQWMALLILTFAISMAATGYGILIGTIFTSQTQASIFGSISVVILAALGGIWVPIFMMSNLMQALSRFSPLNWGLHGYYNILLRHSGISGITTDVFLLLGFFMVSVLGAWLYQKRKKG